MRKSLLFALMLCFTAPLIAQEKPLRQELGLTFTDINSFGLTYRQGGDEALWRFRAFSALGNTNNETADSSNRLSRNFDLFLGAGREYRAPLADRFQLRYGADLVAGINYDRNEAEQIRSNGAFEILSERQVYMVGINLVLGINYQVSEQIILGAEVLPSVRYGFGNERRIEESSFSGRSDTRSAISRWDYSLSTGSVLFSAVYVF